MNSVEKIFKIMQEEGADIEGKEDEIRDELAKALSLNQLYTIYRGDKVIGFFTWWRKAKGIFINNLVIYRKYRNKNNLLGIRETFRKMVGDNFYWGTKRRGRYAYVQ